MAQTRRLVYYEAVRAADGCHNDCGARDSCAHRLVCSVLCIEPYMYASGFLLLCMGNASFDGSSSYFMSVHVLRLEISRESISKLHEL